MTYWTQHAQNIATMVDVFIKQRGKHQYVIVDGGAAGGLSEPFDAVEQCIKSIRFEPRGGDTVEQTEGCVFIDGGLWSEDTVKTLHIAASPTSSSICPPNLDFLAQFEDKYGVPPRQTVNKTDVKLRSIDSCVQHQEMPLPHFIKLDVHSAELPALVGAQNSLENCLGILAETWHAPIHQGQGLNYDFEKFALENGFELYDCMCKVRWRIKHRGQESPADRGRYLGSEVLYIKKDVPQQLMIEKAFTLGLFRFYNEAKNVLDACQIEDTSGMYTAIDSIQSRILNRRERALAND